ncbi:hypothetical protein ZWY2020_010162 [Hordeum vulgare]|nr:hypothetical protein ZWY2020_010162 [Hordeum vulgare]
MIHKLRPSPTHCSRRQPAVPRLRLWRLRRVAPFAPSPQSPASPASPVSLGPMRLQLCPPRRPSSAPVASSCALPVAGSCCIAAPIPIRTRDWLILKNTSTGLGWNDETNTVIADDEWWKKAGEENKDFLQFRKCGPDNLEEMSIMYENINVTGESSMMPGCEHEVFDLEDEIEEIEGTQAKKAKKLPVKIDGTSSKKNPVQRGFKRMVANSMKY